MQKENYFLKTYKRYDVVFVKGSGKYLFDDKNKKYLDFFSGLSVTNLGHCNKRLLRALQKQSQLLWHASNLFYTKPQILLAKELIRRTFKSKIFFSNSGAEANECAIKLARIIEAKKTHFKKEKRYEIITFKNSFHGRTLATLTATGQKKFHKGFEPLIKGFKYAKFNDIDSVKKLITSKTCAVMVEPIQGEGGIIPANKDFLHQLRELCDKYDLLLIFDEIQTGYGRTGELFAYQYYGVKPDVITIAKSIANGLPLGVTLVDEKYANAFDYGEHGSTFGGNLLSCQVGYYVLKLINRRLLNNVKVVGEYFFNRLNDLKQKYNFIVEVRGVGLMLAMELSFPARKVVEDCLKEGLVINVTQNNVLRFLPPLIINKEDVDLAVEILDKVLYKIKNN